MSELLRKLKGKRSSGLDWICGYSLKLSSTILSEELRHIINTSIRTGKFCKSLKKTKIIPIYKNKGSRLQKKFYRPVANVSELSKLAEMAIYNQVYMFLNSNGLLHPDHHGFMKHRSTTTAIQQLRDFWLQNVEEGKLCYAILMDLSSGFNFVNPKLLCESLQLYGFNDTSLA